MLQLLGLLLLFVVVLIIIKQASLASIFHVSHRLIGTPHIGIWFYSVFFFLGTVIHELSHFFMAELLRVNTGGIHLLPHYEGTSLTLGYVKVVKSDPIRSLLIGIAPFVVGLTATTVVARFYFADLAAIGTVNHEFVVLLWHKLKDPVTWAVLYLLLVVSQSMFPSKADRGEIILIPITVAVLGIIGYLLWGSVSVPDYIINGITQLLAVLDTSLGIILAINVVFLLVLVTLRKFFETLF